MAAPSPTLRARPSPTGLSGDLSGGLASGIVAITGNVAAGVIAFSPLGPGHTGIAVVAGMLSSVVAGTLCALFGGAPGMISGPKATTAMAFAAMLGHLVAAGSFDLSLPEHVRVVLSLAFTGVLFSGLAQVLLGSFRVGGLVKFIPYPVVAGIRNTAALLLVLSQVWPALGAPRQSLLSLLADPGQIQLASVAVAAVTALVVARGGRFLHKAAVPVAALVAGTALHHAIGFALPDARLGPLLGRVPLSLDGMSYVGSMAAALTTPEYLRLLPVVLSGALAIAVLDSLSSMVTLVGFESVANRRFDANRQLLGQGIGTSVAALMGGLSTSGIFARAATNHGAGGRTRLSGVANGFAVLVLLLVLARPLAVIPKAAVAGLILVIATGILDRWSLGRLREALDPERRRRPGVVRSAIEIVLVTAVGLWQNLVAAVVAGVGLSVLFFVGQMSRSPIRRLRTGRGLRSLRRRAPRVAEALRAEGHRIAVMELDGTIFFGSCDAVAERVERLAGDGVDFVVLDLKRVSRIDTTGYRVLGQTFRRLKEAGVTLAFSYVGAHGTERAEIAGELQEAASIPESSLFATTDEALEYFENALLVRIGLDDEEGPALSVADFADRLELSGEERKAFARELVERRFRGGERIVREHDAGDSMFFVAKGAIDITIPVEEVGRDRRLATLAQGTTFGEVALLDGLPRSADAVAQGEIVCYELTRASLEALQEHHPTAALKVYRELGRILGTRLRESGALIEELDR